MADAVTPAASADPPAPAAPAAGAAPPAVAAPTVTPNAPAPAATPPAPAPTTPGKPKVDPADPEIQELLAAARRSAAAEAREAAKADAKKEADRAKLEEADRLKLEKQDAEAARTKAEADLVAEKIKSQIALTLVGSDVKLASPQAFGIVEHLVAEKVKTGVALEHAVGAVLTEHPYLKATAPAPAGDPAAAGALGAAAPPPSTTPQTGAPRTSAPAAATPPTAKSAMDMTRGELEAYRRELGIH